MKNGLGSGRSLLLRDYLRKSLYEQGVGYFQVTDCVYTPPAGKLRFRELQGQFEYKQTLAKLYKGRSESWLTPVEIFSPWYSRALGRYIVQQHEDHQGDGIGIGIGNGKGNGRGTGEQGPLRIVEVGGGNGTNAANVLDYLRETAPAVYARCSYTLVEISEAMAQRQEDRVRAAGHLSSHCSVVNDDMCAWSGAAVEEPCFVVALEVLDNLPHDRLRRAAAPPAAPTAAAAAAAAAAAGPFSAAAAAPAASAWTQATVDEALREERFEKMTDPLALQAAALFCKDDDEDVFVPTGALQLFETLRAKFPQHRLIAADFDALPSPDVSLWTRLFRRGEHGSVLHGRNAPLVASKDAGGNTVDHSSYLVPPGSADIFFATDFQALARAYESVTGRAATTRKSSPFLRDFADHTYTRTRSGYNPLLDDYENTAFLLS